MKTHCASIGLCAALAAANAHQAHHEHAVRDTANSTDVSGITRGIKAGLSGYQGIQNKKAFQQLAGSISWYSDYQPDTPEAQGVAGVPMLWGDSTSCGSIGSGRMSAFNTAVASKAPKIMFGFYEPDCSCSSSSDMTVSDGVSSWNQYIAPLGDKNTILGSPSAPSVAVS